MRSYSSAPWSNRLRTKPARCPASSYQPRSTGCGAAAGAARANPVGGTSPVGETRPVGGTSSVGGSSPVGGTWPPACASPTVSISRGCRPGTTPRGAFMLVPVDQAGGPGRRSRRARVPEIARPSMCPRHRTRRGGWADRARFFAVLGTWGVVCLGWSLAAPVLGALLPGGRREASWTGRHPDRLQVPALADAGGRALPVRVVGAGRRSTGTRRW